MSKRISVHLFLYFVLSVLLAFHANCLPFGYGGGEGKQSVYPNILPQLVCPSPFELEGETCTLLNVVEPTFTCAKQTGYFENGQCMTVSEVAAVPKCPNGTEYDGRRCVLIDVRPPTVYCPRGFAANSDATGCFSEHTRKSQPKCPHGHTFKNGNCMKEIILPTTPICPNGYVIQTNGNNRPAECVLVEIAGQVATCPNDYQLEGNTCVSNKKAEATAYCPHGLQEEGQFCTRVHRVEPDAVCTAGELSTNGKDCLVMEVDEVSVACKKDFVLDKGRCVRAYESEPQHVGCPHGSKLVENQCISYESFAPELSCPDGTVLSEKHCILTEEIPLSYRCLRGELSQTQTCLLHDRTKPQSVCREGHTKHDDQCISSRSVKAELACENGEIEGKFCITHISVAAEAFCRDGKEEVKNGACVNHSKKNVQLGCPEGFKLQAEGCFAHVEDSLDQRCPEGTSIRGKVCETHVIVPPLYSCPRNFMMDPSGNCFMSEFAEPIVMCPIGLHMFQGQCVPTKHSKL